MSILAGAIIAGATTGGNIAAGAIGNKKRIKAAKDAATKANQRNIENWKRQNAYNDPSQQMARLKAAGLNPNMVYGTGTQASGQAGSTPAAAAPVPNIQNIKTSGGIEAYTNMQQLGIMQAQKENIEANTQNTNMQTNVASEKWTEMEMSNWLQGVAQNWWGTQVTDQKGNIISIGDFKNQLASGTMQNQAMKSKLAEMAKKETDAKIAEYGIDIAQYKSKLAQFGVETSDELYVRMAAVFTIEKGYDLNTARGATMGAQALVQIISMFTKAGALKSIVNPQRGKSIRK